MFNNPNNGINTFMPVQPAVGGYGGYGGGLFGGDGIWALLFILALFNGGWGGFGGFGWGGMGAMGAGMMGLGMDGFGLYPWLNNSQNINGGFRDQMISSKLDAISGAVNGGFSDVQLGLAGLGRDICQTGNTITGAVRDGFFAVETSENARQMALLQQLFGIQSTQLQSGCENRAATADLKFTVAAEAAATRASNSADTQKVLDKLCQLELDGVRRELAAEQRENANLRSDLQYARGESSLIEKNAILSDRINLAVDNLYSRLKNCPVGTYSVCNPVAPPYNQSGCSGCGGNNYGYGYAAA